MGCVWKVGRTTAPPLAPGASRAGIRWTAVCAIVSARSGGGNTTVPFRFWIVQARLVMWNDGGGRFVGVYGSSLFVAENLFRSLFSLAYFKKTLWYDRASAVDSLSRGSIKVAFG
jgi:hypothetical protein